MLKQINGLSMVTECNYCLKESITDLTGVVIKKNMFGEWTTLNVVCSCGNAEAYNLNIPVDDIDEPIQTGDIRVEEEVQRHYVRILIRLVREDFVNAN